VTRNGAAIDVKGLTSFTNDLRAVADDEPKAMKRAYGRIASHVQSRSRSNATAAGGQFAKAKSAIRGSSDHESASVGVSRSGRIPYAQGTFWGARGRFGPHKKRSEQCLTPTGEMACDDEQTTPEIEGHVDDESGDPVGAPFAGW
jgi:hypothetical protein